MRPALHRSIAGPLGRRLVTAGSEELGGVEGSGTFVLLYPYQSGTRRTQLNTIHMTMTEHDRTRRNNRRLFDPFWPFWGTSVYHFRPSMRPKSWQMFLQQKWLCLKMSAWLATCRWQGSPMEGCYGKHWIKDLGSWAVLTGQLSNRS